MAERQVDPKDLLAGAADHVDPALQARSGKAADARAASRVVDGELEEQLVHEAFLKALTEMEKDGDRIAYRGPASGAVNNLVGTAMMLPASLGLNVSPPSGCEGQSMTMRAKLKYQKPFRDWNFEMRATYDPSDITRLLPFSGYHWVVKAIAPSGRLYLLDANNNKFGTWGAELDKHFWFVG